VEFQVWNLDVPICASDTHRFNRVRDQVLANLGLFLNSHSAQCARSPCLRVLQEIARRWATYSELLDLSAMVRFDRSDLGPRDLIDVQSFLWVQGSEDYQGRSIRSLQTTRVAALQKRAS
jgi:hypothetical protein